MYMNAIQSVFKGDVTADVETYVKSLSRPIDDENPVRIFATNEEVDFHNSEKLLDMPGKLKLYESIYRIYLK